MHSGARCCCSRRSTTLLLAGIAHPLATFYRSVVGDAVRSDVDRAAPAFFDFARQHRDAIAGSLATRATQTNEVGRAAGLRLALATLNERRPVALIDVGCSAGLNLLVDRYRFAYRLVDGSEAIAGPPSDVLVSTDIVSGRPDIARDVPPIVRRIGIDRSPLDANDPRDARWLQACVWPGDAARHARLAAALDAARSTWLDIRRGDAADLLDDVLAGLGPDPRPVVFHSWVVSYFDGQARRRFVDAVRAMVADRDGAWISAEGPNVVPGLAAPPLPDDADAARARGDDLASDDASRRRRHERGGRTQPSALPLDRMARRLTPGQRARDSISSSVRIGVGRPMSSSRSNETQRIDSGADRRD